MPKLQVVSEDALPLEEVSSSSFPLMLVMQWAIGIVAAFALGTWLVWWAALVQRTFTVEDIRSACQRVMPESVERCIDTVTIQRGGARR
jgi:hypothetical protein